MSINYGNCDNSDCWYQRNTDRLNEYCDDDDVLCVSNNENINNEGLYLYNYKPPLSFTLCDVCYADTGYKIKGICKYCKGHMIDKGIEIKDKEYCCRFCFEEFCEYYYEDNNESNNLLLYMDWKKLIKDEGKIREDILKILDYQDNKLDKQNEIEKQKREDFCLNIKKTCPNLTDDNLQLIINILNNKNTNIEEITTHEKLINTLIRYIDY